MQLKSANATVGFITPWDAWFWSAIRFFIQASIFLKRQVTLRLVRSFYRILLRFLIFNYEQFRPFHDRYNA
jgi:hypothetical protein